MRVTTINQLAVTLRLPPSSLSALRDLSLDDVAKLRDLIEQTQARHRVQMDETMNHALGFLPTGPLYRLFTRGRRQ